MSALRLLKQSDGFLVMFTSGVAFNTSIKYLKPVRGIKDHWDPGLALGSRLLQSCCFCFAATPTPFLVCSLNLGEGKEDALFLGRSSWLWPSLPIVIDLLLMHPEKHSSDHFC